MNCLQTSIWMMAGTVIAAAPSHAGELDPVADPQALVVAGSARFTLLTPRLVRMEWSPGGAFEDRASQAFIRRKQTVPKFTQQRDGEWLVIKTEALELRYRQAGGKFSAENLRIAFKAGAIEGAWTPGMPQQANLRGTWRTLDGVSGASQLEPGLIARDGWTLIDDSQRLLLDNSDWPWAAPRSIPDALDWYFFCYGRDYGQALRDYTAVAGAIPLPPRFVFGAWWSRYWAYSEQELRQLVGEFEQHDVPLDVLVIDMDWHLDGWTGYTWNPKYFPDPEGFLRWLRQRGLKVTLNLHPADGVGKHEAAFPEMARALGLDPAKVERVPFDSSDRRFVEAYFKYLHHPLEQQGVDFWWMDWQQGTQTRIPGLDPLWWLNYLHWTDLQRNPQRANQRPLIFSRWGGLGNHRYQIGFSGDTFCDWRSLAFQPYFTATAGNVGYPYWSHDIGGHQPGPVEPELYVRWIQWAALNPVLRTHTTKNPQAERRIWAFDDETFKHAREAWLLRYSLVPYLYGAARQTFDTSLPLCRPLYYAWPELDEAYKRPGQYLLGDDLLCAPVTEPVDPVSRCAMLSVWIPPGSWTHWFTGRTYEGPREVLLQVPMDQIPLFARSGAIIPRAPHMKRTDEKPLDPLILDVFTAADRGATRVYEDDGASLGYASGKCAWTPVRFEREGNQQRVVIDAAQGAFDGMLKQRSFEVRLRDTWPPEQVLLDGQPLAAASDANSVGWRYDADQFTLLLRTPPRDVRQPTTLTARSHAEATRERELPLRSGLRGRFAEVREVRSLYGELAPPLVVSMAELPGQMAGAPRGFWQIGQHAVENWPTLLDDVTRASEYDARQARAVARLLSLWPQVRVTVDPLDARRLIARVALAPTDGLPVAKNLSGTLVLDVEPPWRIEGKAAFGASNFSESAPAIITAPLVLDDQSAPLQAGAIRGSLSMRVNQIPVELRFEREFLPSVNAWMVVGPFSAPFDQGLKTPFEPEKKLDLNASYPGPDGTPIVWKPALRTLKPEADLLDEHFVHLHDFFGKRHENAVAYAFTLLHSPYACEAVLALGSDDGIAVWLNGQEVHRNDVGRPYSSKQDRVTVKLNEGFNTLLLKVHQGGGDWGFSAHVETSDGRPFTQIRAQLAP